MRWLAIVALLAALLLGALLWLSQAFGGSALKPELEALLSDRTGLTAHIDGELQWRYLWPTAVTLSQVRATDGSDTAPITEAWTLDSIRLEIDTGSLLRAPRNPQRWAVLAFQIEGLRGERGAVGTGDSERFSMPDFWIRQLRPDSAAPFAARLRYATTETGELELDLAGRLRFVPSERRMLFEPLKLSGNIVTGTCRADLALQVADQRPGALAAAGADGVLDLFRWRTTDWDASCELAELNLGSERFPGATLTTRNQAGAAKLSLGMPAFFGGEGSLAINIDGSAAAAVPQWLIEPRVTAASSERLLRWFGEARTAASNEPAPPIPWKGPINLSGKLVAEGNDRAALIRSGIGEVTLVSTAGSLDLRGFKRQANEPLEKLGSVLGEKNLLGSWPDDLAYQELFGRWEVDRGAQAFRGHLDNLRLDGSGAIDPAARADDDRLRLNGTLLFSGTGERKSLPVNALLEDVPLPFRCEGSTRRPACAVDGEQAKGLVADALEQRSGQLAEKLDQIIEEKVPKEYQRAARGLLEIFSKSVADEEEASDEEFLSGADDFEF